MQLEICNQLCINYVKSKPISRVLSWIIICLVLLLLIRSSELPFSGLGRASLLLSLLFLHRMGFT